MSYTNLRGKRASWEHIGLTQGDLLGILRALEWSGHRWIAAARADSEANSQESIYVNSCLWAYDKETFGKLYPLLERAHETPVKFPEWPEDL